MRADDRSITYAELDRQTDCIAAHLVERGVQANAVVGLRLSRSIDAVMAILGILKVGTTYWPIEENLPDERLRHMLADAAPHVVIVGNDGPLHLPDFPQSRVATIGSLLQPAGAHVETGIVNAATDAASIHYTSGSTGAPKGVPVPHRAVLRLVCNADYCTLDAQQVLLQLAPLSFDLAAFEIWGALLNGGCLVLLPPGPPALAQIGDAIRMHGVTTALMTPGVFNLMVDQRIDDLKPLRQLLLCGDVVSPAHARTARRALPLCMIVNCYGPTENATFTTAYTMRADDAMEHTVSIGKPVANTQVYVLDKHRRVVPVGLPGELYTGGDGVALGYLNRPQLTAASFVADPFAGVPGARMYRTGDLVRWRADGNLEFLGRADRQIKLRGFRMEIAEIEAVLLAQPQVLDGVVVVHVLPDRQKELVAYLVAREEVEIAAAEVSLRAAAAVVLPAYMVPRFVVWIDRLPLNIHGKLDRNALPAPVAAAHLAGNLAIAADPAGVVEEGLVRLWQQIFGTDSIGVHDNFFRLGGHSLMAVRLVAEIDRSFGIQLPIAALFQSPTVHDLAQRLTSGRRDSPWPSLVPLRPHGTRPPLFAVHGVHGDVYGLLDLARLMPDDQPVYGVQGAAADGQTSLPATLTIAAAEYARQIDAFQPQGPVYLVGYSLGGTYAMETARQLSAMGRSIGMLALYDTQPAGNVPWLFYAMAMTIELPLLVRKHLRRMFAAGLRGAVTYLRGRWPAVKFWLYYKNRGISQAAALAAGGDPALYKPKNDPYRLLAKTHRPQRAPIHADFFLSADTVIGYWFYWRSLLTAGISLHRLPGLHTEMLKGDDLVGSAAALSSVLRRRQDAADRT